MNVLYTCRSSNETRVISTIRAPDDSPAIALAPAIIPSSYHAWGPTSLGDMAAPTAQPSLQQAASPKSDQQRQPGIERVSESAASAPSGAAQVSGEQDSPPPRKYEPASADAMLAPAPALAQSALPPMQLTHIFGKPASATYSADIDLTLGPGLAPQGAYAPSPYMGSSIVSEAALSAEYAAGFKAGYSAGLRAGRRALVGHASIAEHSNIAPFAHSPSMAMQASAPIAEGARSSSHGENVKSQPQAYGHYGDATSYVARSYGHAASPSQPAYALEPRKTGTSPAALSHALSLAALSQPQAAPSYGSQGVYAHSYHHPRTYKGYYSTETERSLQATAREQAARFQRAEVLSSRAFGAYAKPPGQSRGSQQSGKLWRLTSLASCA